MRAHEVTACAACGKHPLQSGVGGGRAITFFHLQAQRVVLDHQAAQSLVGLTMQFGGNAAMADVFTPRPDVYLEPPELRQDLIICDNCAAEHPVFELLELAAERAGKGGEAYEACEVAS